MDWMEERHKTSKRVTYYRELEKLFRETPGKVIDKLVDFPKYVPNNIVSRFLARYELTKLILDVPGSIIECGVLGGFGIFSFAHASSILEPYNQNRRIIGFDTFGGFPSLSKIDKLGTSKFLKQGGYGEDHYKDILKAVKTHDDFRLLTGKSQMELVKGDMVKTVPSYVKDHPELVVALLYLDCDLYQPTKVALKYFLKLMPGGAIIVCDELDSPEFPGESYALKGILAPLKKYRFNKFPFSKVAYLKIGE